MLEVKSYSFDLGVCENFSVRNAPSVSRVSADSDVVEAIRRVHMQSLSFQLQEKLTVFTLRFGRELVVSEHLAPTNECRAGNKISPSMLLVLPAAYQEIWFGKVKVDRGLTDEISVHVD